MSPESIPFHAICITGMGSPQVESVDVRFMAGCIPPGPGKSLSATYVSSVIVSVNGAEFRATRGETSPIVIAEATGAQFNRKVGLRFGLRFPTLRKRSKIGSLDMSQNQNRISSHFSSQNSRQFFFY